ncbi:hypothetical protein ACFQWC_14785 [Rossellomorea sp. GCM10028870]
MRIQVKWGEIRLGFCENPGEIVRNPVELVKNPAVYRENPSEW